MLNCLKLFVATALITLLIIANSFAQCTTQVGQLSTPNFQKDGSVYVCYEDTFKVELSDFQLAEGQTLYYVYHNENYIWDFHKIDTTETNGLANKELNTNKIYVTAIATNDSSFLEINDTCTVFSNTIEVNFLEPIGFDWDYECRYGYSNDYIDILYAPRGSLPQIDTTFNYYISGDITDTLANKQIDSLTINALSSTIYLINVTDGLCATKEILRIQWCYDLPLDFLLVFTGKVTDEGHLIKWVTNGEINNSHFILQVSGDAVNWETVDTIQGAGTTSQPTSYQAYNKNITFGSNYYKLLQVDFDGTFSHLHTIEVIHYPTSVYPNPSKQYLNFSNNGEALENIEITISDISGRQVARFTQDRNNQFKLSIRYCFPSIGHLFFKYYR